MTSPCTHTPPRRPFAYLVVQASGFIVGAWKDRETAEHVASLKPAFDKERVVEVFTEDQFE